MTAVNLNRAIRGPVTAVPVVAGKGVRIVPDTVNNRFFVEADETVLWENTDGVSSTNFPLTLSESISNFERVKIFWRPWSSNYTVSEKFTTDTQYFLEADWGSVASDINTYHFLCCISINGTSATFNKQIFQQWGTTTINNNSTNFRIYKIVGIHRIASN